MKRPRSSSRPSSKSDSESTCSSATTDSKRSTATAICLRAKWCWQLRALNKLQDDLLKQTKNYRDSLLEPADSSNISYKIANKFQSWSAEFDVFRKEWADYFDQTALTTSKSREPRTPLTITCKNWSRSRKRCKTWRLSTSSWCSKRTKAITYRLPWWELKNEVSQVDWYFLKTNLESQELLLCSL